MGVSFERAGPPGAIISAAQGQLKDTGDGYCIGIVFDYPHQPESNRLFLATKAVLGAKK